MKDNQKYNEFIEIYTKTTNQDAAMRILYKTKHKCSDLQCAENDSIVTIKSFKFSTEKSVLKVCISVQATADQMFDIYNEIWSFWQQYSMLPPMFLHPNKEHFYEQMEVYSQTTDK